MVLRLPPGIPSKQKDGTGLENAPQTSTSGIVLLMLRFFYLLAWVQHFDKHFGHINTEPDAAHVAYLTQIGGKTRVHTGR